MSVNVNFLVILMVTMVAQQKKANKTNTELFWVFLTPSHWEVAIATVKIVSTAHFQLLYSAHAPVNTMKEGLPWLLYIW